MTALQFFELEPMLMESSQKDVMFQKLLEAKDAAVRAKLYWDKP